MSSALRTVIMLLLMPSWIVGAGAVLIAVDTAGHVLREPFSQMVGNTVLVGGFLVAPLATLVATGLGISYTISARRQTEAAGAAPRGAGIWTLIGASVLCIIAAWIAMARAFTS